MLPIQSLFPHLVGWQLVFDHIFKSYLIGIQLLNTAYLPQKVKMFVAQSCTTFCKSHRLQPLSMEFSRPEYWSRLPFLSSGDLPNPEIEPGSPVLQAASSLSEPPRKLFPLYLHSWLKSPQGSHSLRVLFIFLGAQCSVMADSFDQPGSSVHGIFQARTLEWVTISYFRRSSQPKESNPHLLCILHWQVDSLPLEPPGKLRFLSLGNVSLEGNLEVINSHLPGQGSEMNGITSPHPPAERRAYNSPGLLSSWPLFSLLYQAEVSCLKSQ